MKDYLQLRFYNDNQKKYHKYFEEWFENLTLNQLYYFNIDMRKTNF